MKKGIALLLLIILFFLNIGVANANVERTPFEKAYFEIGYKSVEEALDDCETYFNKNIILPYKLPPLAFTHSFGRCSTDNYGTDAEFEIEYLNENSPKAHYKINIRPKVHGITFRQEQIDKLYKLNLGRDIIRPMQLMVLTCLFLKGIAGSIF